MRVVARRGSSVLAACKDTSKAPTQALRSLTRVRSKRLHQYCVQEDIDSAGALTTSPLRKPSKYRAKTRLQLFSETLHAVDA